MRMSPPLRIRAKRLLEGVFSGGIKKSEKNGRGERGK